MLSTSFSKALPGRFFVPLNQLSTGPIRGHMGTQDPYLKRPKSQQDHFNKDYRNTGPTICLHQVLNRPRYHRLIKWREPGARRERHGQFKYGLKSTAPQQPGLTSILCHLTDSHSQVSSRQCSDDAAMTHSTPTPFT